MPCVAELLIRNVSFILVLLADCLAEPLMQLGVYRSPSYEMGGMATQTTPLKSSQRWKQGHHMLNLQRLIQSKAC